MKSTLTSYQLPVSFSLSLLFTFFSFANRLRLLAYPVSLLPMSLKLVVYTLKLVVYTLTLLPIPVKLVVYTLKLLPISVKLVVYTLKALFDSFLVENIRLKTMQIAKHLTGENRWVNGFCPNEQSTNSSLESWGITNVLAIKTQLGGDLHRLNKKRVSQFLRYPFLL